MPSNVVIGGVKPEEAIAFIRNKLKVSTKHWYDMRGAVHAKAFTVAGATKADLLNDLHSSMIDAVEEGQSIGQFRKAFDQAVAKHGWSYKGKRGWRTRIIYDTNMRTAHMAGRWQQIQRTKSVRPYLIYYTVGDSRVRQKHREWHAVALHVDDAWWDSHYPPNDFGCRCYVVSANNKTLERLGITVKDAPTIETTERINTATGEVYGDVPVGIGTGWDYNVGKAWLGSDVALGEKLASMPAELLAGVSLSAANKQIDTAFAMWATGVLKDGKTRARMQTVGFLDGEQLAAAKRVQPNLKTTTIVISDRRLLRMVREIKQRRGISVDNSLLLTLPQQLRNAQAILRDKKDGRLVFVIGDKGRKAKIIVALNFKERDEVANSVISASTAQLDSLKNKGLYEVIYGEL